MPTTHKHSATDPTQAEERPDVVGRAHRAARTWETAITLTLGTLLIVLAATMALRG